MSTIDPVRDREVEVNGIARKRVDTLRHGNWYSGMGFDKAPGFSSDTILPIQMLNDPHTDPRKKLFIAMLMVAIVDAEYGCKLSGYATQQDRSDRLEVDEDSAAGRAALRLRAQTRAWFMSKDKEWAGSFESICDLLDLDAGAVRKAVRARWS